MTASEMSRPSELDQSVGRVITLDWEKVAWAAIIVLTLVTRLYDLGNRAMSHDESLHTFYSWKLYFGQDYSHDPMMHGPLLFHATALSYLLFGVSDFTARLFSVVTGLALVLSPYLVRKWLGSVGSLATAVVLLVSPTVMYYSRYIRHDIQVELFTVLMLIGFVRFLDNRANRWIVLAFTAAALGIASAEMVYITGFVLVLCILGALLTERMSERASGIAALTVAGIGLGLLVFASLAVEGMLTNVADFTQGRPKDIQQVSLLASGLLMVLGLFMTMLTRFRTPTSVLEPPADDDDAASGLTLADVVVGNLSLVLVGVGVVALGIGVYLASRSCVDDVAANNCRLAYAILAGGGVVLAYGFLGWLLDRYQDRALASAIGRARLDGLVTGVVVFAVIYLLLFTTFFSNAGWPSYSEGRSGFIASVRYWWEQHDVVRGDQPFYYYALMVPIYEFVALFPALAGMLLYFGRPDLRVARGNDTGSERNPSPAAALFVPMLFGWAAGVFWIFSWAGEKMPWLMVHMAVPLAFIAGRWVADTVDRVDWAALRDVSWKIAGLAALAFLAAGFLVVQLLMAATPAEMSRAMVGAVLLAGLVWGMWRVSRGVSRRQVRLVAALAIAGVLLIANTRVSLIANFVNEEDAVEYIVYAHGTPDDKDTYELLKDMQVRLGDQKLRIGYDNEVSWPFTWYFREDDWPQTPTYLGEAPSSAQALNDLDVVLIGSPNYGKFEPYMRKDFASNEVRRMWWPNEGYKGFSFTREGWEKLRENFTDPMMRRNWLNILLHRRYTEDPRADTPKPKSLYDWYHHANMKIFIKRELVAQVWPNEAERPAGFKETQATEAIESVDVLTVPIEQVYELDPGGKALVQPKGIALDGDGNLYVADSGNYQIVKFGPDGRALAAFGSGELKAPTGNATGEAWQASAWGVGIAPDGAVYVADTWNHRVVKYVDGKQVLTFGTYGTPADPTQNLGEFWGPRDVAVDDGGNVYVTDTGNKRVQMFDSAGKPLRAFGGTGLNPGQFNEPTGIAYSAALGEFYVADLWNLRVQVFDRDFSFVREFAVDGWDSQDAPYKGYIAVGPGGHVVVTDPSAARVWVFDGQGKPLGTLDLPMDPKGLQEPIGIDVDAQGRIYVASSAGNVVTRYAMPEAMAPGAGAAASPESGAAGDAASPESGTAADDAASPESGTPAEDGAAAEPSASPDAAGATGSPAAPEGGDGGAAGSGSAGGGAVGPTSEGGVNAPSPPNRP